MREFNIGSIVPFGGYHWRILDIQGNAALIITEYIIHGDSNIGIQGNGTFRYSSNTIHPSTGDNSGGVRPALWLSMEL